VRRACLAGLLAAGGLACASPAAGPLGPIASREDPGAGRLTLASLATPPRYRVVREQVGGQYCNRLGLTEYLFGRPSGVLVNFAFPVEMALRRAPEANVLVKARLWIEHRPLGLPWGTYCTIVQGDAAVLE
jgi:hypothetical protein